MMPPKEKAKNLLDKMNVIHYVKLGGKNQESKGLPVFMHDDQVKQCALFAVDEILNTIQEIFETFEERQYWKEVKEELLKINGNS